MMVPPLVRTGWPPLDARRYMVLHRERGWLEVRWLHSELMDVNASNPVDMRVNPHNVLCWMPQDGT